VAILQQLKAETDEALETLRDLARGIYPPLLAASGLVTALEAQARKAALPVEVRANTVSRYSQDVEAAIYFCVLEALQNVQKYAHAASVIVRIDGSGAKLLFAVEDDGMGFDPATRPRGSGLTNMADRLDALGGAVAVRSKPGEGTAVSGSLPLPAQVGAV
jgi:signal transduction histidine kinase